MAVSTVIFDNFPLEATTKKSIDWDSDTLAATLHDSGMAPNRATWKHETDLTNELPTANGYTAGGITLTGCAATLVPSASTPDWAPNTAYAVGMIVAKVADNGHVYRCVQAGASGATEPAWNVNPGATQPTDGTCVWVEAGRAWIKYSCDALQWSGTFTARYLVISDKTPGAPASNPLVLYVDFGADQVSPGVFKIVPSATYGIFQVFLN